jgi:hypothetical protein
MDDLIKKLTNLLVEGAVKGYGAVADRSKMPSNKRLYLETFADENRNPITERNFTEQELQTIAALIRAKQAADPYGLSGVIQYKDYMPFLGTKETSQNAGVNAGERNPFENIRTSLGQFRYVIDPNTGAVRVMDQYDFNRLPENKVVQAMSRGDYVVNTLDPYSILRIYAGERMPPGTGRPVQVNMPGLFSGIKR